MALADGQNIGQYAGTDGAIAHGRADLQVVVARLQVGRQQEHQLRGVIFADYSDLGDLAAGADKEDALGRVGGIELEPVAGHLAHAAGSQQVVELTTVQVRIVQRSRLVIAAFLLFHLGALHRPAEPDARVDRSLDAVAAGGKAIGLAVKAALDSDAIVGPRGVHVEAQQQAFNQELLLTGQAGHNGHKWGFNFISHVTFCAPHWS